MSLTKAQQMEQFIKARERYQTRVQDCVDLIGKNDKQQIFRVRCENLASTWDKFEYVTDQIHILNAQLKSTEEPTSTVEETKKFEELFFQVKAHLAQLNQEAAEAEAAAASSFRASTSRDSTNPSTSFKLKLPTISIPIFSGDITAFPSWKSLYDEIVHTCNQLSDIQKFSYLKQYLQSPALSTIENVSFSAANYPLAYRTLCDRFSKKRIIAACHLNKILQFQPLTKDTVTSLSSYLDEFCTTVESLRGLNLPDFREFVLVHHCLRALDPKTRMEFETEKANVVFPNYDDVVSFVKAKRSVLEVYSVESTSTSHQSVVKSKPQTTSKMLVATNVEPENKAQLSKPFNSNREYISARKCSACDHVGHMLSKCYKFLKMDPSQRFTVVKQAKLCFGCFGSTHSSLNCQSKYKCRVCNSSSHNTLLHPVSSDQKPSTSTNLPISGVMQSSLQSCSSILLGTAIVKVQDYMGAWIPVRCVIDPGSQISAVTEKLAQTLKLPRGRSTIQISGIGSANPIQSRGEVKCEVSPHLESSCEPLCVHAVVLPRIAADLPSSIPTSVLQRFAHLQLADSSYLHKQVSTCIDMLIGAEHYAHIVLSNMPIITGFPSAIPSKFGWLLMGSVQEDGVYSSTNQPKCTSLFISSIEDPISTQLQRFWEMENVSDIPPVENPEDLACEEHFVRTHYRDPSGTYVVSLPFRNNQPPTLGTNKSQAVSRLSNLKKRLDKNPKLKELYADNLNDYLIKGHMVPTNMSSDYLLVHHGVHKESSSTTKLRVVFDPNVKGSNQLSLAESLMVGPKLQKDIGDLLTTFRLNAVALTCDIQAMYRSIWVTEADRKYQHVLWMEKDNPEFKEFELTTVTFGLPPSPFQAQRVLKQLVLDEGSNYPCAAPVVLDDIYVDDVVTGSQSVSEVIDLRDQLIALLRSGGFSVRKFASSHPDVLDDLPPEACELSHNLGSDDSIKLLGMKWNPTSDVFFYSIIPPESTEMTKRKILSSVASIYDLNGYLSPITIWMKIFLQKMWLDSNLSWDTPLSEHLQEKWKTFTAELPLVSDIKISRYIPSANSKSISLVGFADASISAYSCIVYLRVCDTDDDVRTYLIRAKSKVAPLKVQTINRLELNAAYLLVKTVKSLKFLSQKLSIDNVYLFSDSAVVLSWLKTPPYLLKIYVGNRVTQILESSEPSQWRHVTTDKNSADPASRGLMPSQLVSNGLWFKGPSFLKQSPEVWPKPLATVQQPIPELRPSTTLVIKTEDNYLMKTIENFSSLTKVKRVIAFVLRFIDNCRNRASPIVSSNLTLSELDRALTQCIRITQQCHMNDELKSVSLGQPCAAHLRNLSPIINSTAILAVGGRLSRAPIPEGSKHPILLPAKAYLTKLLIESYHQLTLHGGPKVVQSLLQRKYWIIGARNQIRSILSKCVKCVKMKPLFHQPVMADLPVSRFAQGRAFINVGVDLAGPFSLKSGPRRNSPIVKAYFAIFICMATKAIHLELLSSLSTPCFLASLDRFIGRRGLPSSIYSDNGTNFQGAARHISETYQFLLNSHDQIASHLLLKEIFWIFNPPSAPNFGGLWEAGVKSVKGHLKHVISDHSFNYEEFNTLLVQIEAILNSRPLCALGANPNDGVDILTPGHFLTGAPLLARPESDVSQTYIPPLKRWLLIVQASQCFWKRWRSDYLNTLIQRNKWTSSSNSLKINDVVIIQSQSSPPQQWPLGVVTKVMPGEDNVVRVVTVRTSNGELIRPVSKLAVLPVSAPQQ